MGHRPLPLLLELTATGIADEGLSMAPVSEWSVSTPTPAAPTADEEADSPTDGLPIAPPAEDLNTQ